MTWYQKILTKFRKELLMSAIVSLIVSFLLLLWHYNFGKSFEWTNLEVLSVPTFFERALYSAIVFVTLGRLLYWIGVYQVLHLIFVSMLGVFRLYKGIKKLLWWGLMLAMYFWIIPKTVEVVNAIISFFYNVVVYLLYLAPRLIGSFIIISLIVILFRQYKDRFLHGLLKK